MHNLREIRLTTFEIVRLFRANFKRHVFLLLRNDSNLIVKHKEQNLILHCRE